MKISNIEEMASNIIIKWKRNVSVLYEASRKCLCNIGYW